MPGFELPPARSFVDRVFIMVLHGPAAQPGLDHYGAAFGNPASATFDVSVPFMALYQGLAPDHAYRIGTLVLGAGFYLEMDNSPAHIGPRAVPDGGLPSGIAMVSFEIGAPLAASMPAEGVVYGGRTTCRVTGAFGEWVELLAPARTQAKQRPSWRRPPPSRSTRCCFRRLSVAGCVCAIASCTPP